MSTLPAVDSLLSSMADQLRAHLDARQISDPAFVGINTGGVWVADALHAAVAPEAPMGTLDIASYKAAAGEAERSVPFREGAKCERQPLPEGLKVM